MDLSSSLLAPTCSLWPSTGVRHLIPHGSRRGHGLAGRDHRRLAYAVWAMTDSLQPPWRRSGLAGQWSHTCRRDRRGPRCWPPRTSGLDVASGRAFEGWAAGRARRTCSDFSSAHRGLPGWPRRVADGRPLDEIVPSDIVLIAHGDVVPTDGRVASARAVVDQSAPTGEPLPVERLVTGDRLAAAR